MMKKPSTPLKFTRIGVVRISRGKVFPSLSEAQKFLALCSCLVRLCEFLLSEWFLQPEIFLWTLFSLPSIYPMWLDYTQEMLRDNNNHHRRYLKNVQSSRSFAWIVKLKAVPWCIKMINKSIVINRFADGFFSHAGSKLAPSEVFNTTMGRRSFSMKQSRWRKKTVEETCKDESAIAKLQKHEPSNNNNNMMNLVKSKEKNCTYANCYKPSSSGLRLCLSLILSQSTMERGEFVS